MKRYRMCVGVLLLAGILVSCGGGGGDSPSGGGSPSTTTGGNPPANNNGGNPPANNNGGGTFPSAGARVEESNPAVTLSDGWSPSNSRAGWSGGAAVQSTRPGATASFTFTGTSVRWIGHRSSAGGTALVRVDGGAPITVDLFARPNEFRTPVITLNGLSSGTHTLTIEVISNFVVVDAFDVEPPIVSHLQETDPDVEYSGDWTQDPSASWSGGGVATLPDPIVGGARFTEAAGAKVTLTFRGTSVSWQGGRGPDFGIARVQLEGRAAIEVDTYSETQKFQEVLFTATGLADAEHKLTIEATGRKRAASSAAKIFVDAFDVTTPGRRYQEDDPAITYSGKWIERNVNRVWSEGVSRTSETPGASATFTFTGTSVSWIGCQKESCSGTANVYIDGAFEKTIQNWRRVPIEGYQRTIFRKDGLSPGLHTLTVEVASGSQGYVVVDAFDVHP